MVSLFNDVPLIQHQNVIRIADCGQSVGYYEACSALHQVVHCLLNDAFRSGINRGGCLVQNQYRRVGKNCPGYCQQLLLTCRNVCSFFVNLHVIAPRQSPDEMIRVGGLCSFNNFLIRGFRSAVSDIIHYRIAVKPCVLQNHTEPASQLVSCHASYVAPVHEDFSAVQLVVPH